MLDNGIQAALTKTKFGSNKVLIASSEHLASGFYSGTRGRTDNGATPVPINFANWEYYLYFATVSKNDDSKISQSRFGAWNYPSEYGSGNSCYIKDIDTGIFVNGFDGELVVAATMTATNDNLGSAVDYSTKSVGARLDFWALFTDDSGNV